MMTDEQNNVVDHKQIGQRYEIGVSTVHRYLKRVKQPALT